MYVDIVTSRRGVAHAVVGGYLVPTYIPILLTYSNWLRKDCQDGSGYRTSHKYWSDFNFFLRLAYAGCVPGVHPVCARLGADGYLRFSLVS